MAIQSKQDEEMGNRNLSEVPQGSKMKVLERVSHNHTGWDLTVRGAALLKISWEPAVNPGSKKSQ